MLLEIFTTLSMTRLIYCDGMIGNGSVFENIPFDQKICDSAKCEIHGKWTREEKCEYIKCNPDSCEGDGYFRWSKSIKCEFDVTKKVFLIISSIIYLFFLLILVSTVADDFFSPAISGIVSHLRMSESIAGVTFLAFGNGAPDIFGSFASVISDGNPKADLALGDLFGGAIFVTTIVLAAIIFTKPFKISIIPTIRDLFFFMVSLIFIATCIYKFKRVEIWMPATLLGIYILYIVSVVLLSYLKRQRKRRKIQIEENSKDVESASKSGENIDDDSQEKEIEFGCSRTEIYISHEDAISNEYKSRRTVIHSWNSAEWITVVLCQLRSYPTLEDFRKMNGFLKVIAIFKTIPVFILKLTIPSNEMSWCKPLLVLHLFTSIQFSLLAMQLTTMRPFPGSPCLWVYGLLLSASLSGIVLIFTPLEYEQKFYKEVYSYTGFIISIIWIYVTSKEIISVLIMLGLVTGASQELLGLTIMAWSNCIGDLVTDIAVVRQGFPKMAMAAAIGGPLFNILIGFGLPFLIATIRGKNIELTLNPIFRILIIFLAISLITTTIAIFVQRFLLRIPHSIILILLFMIFISFICLAEFNILKWD